MTVPTYYSSKQVQKTCYYTVILAVNSLAVNILAASGTFPLYIVSKSILYNLYSVKKCFIHTI